MGPVFLWVVFLSGFILWLLALIKTPTTGWGAPQDGDRGFPARTATRWGDPRQDGEPNDTMGSPTTRWGAQRHDGEPNDTMGTAGFQPARPGFQPGCETPLCKRSAGCIAFWLEARMCGLEARNPHPLPLVPKLHLGTRLLGATPLRRRGNGAPMLWQPASRQWSCRDMCVPKWSLGTRQTRQTRQTRAVRVAG